MNMVKYHPMTMFDRIFEGGADLPRTLITDTPDTRVDVIERETEFSVAIELPGMSKDDISVTLDNGHLTITGEKKAEDGDNEHTTWRSERRFGRFTRSFRLGQGIDQKKISADYKDGVLKISVPKAKEAMKKEIEIKVS